MKLLNQSGGIGKQKPTPRLQQNFFQILDKLNVEIENASALCYSTLLLHQRKKTLSTKQLHDDALSNCNHLKRQYRILYYLLCKSPNFSRHMNDPKYLHIMQDYYFDIYNIYKIHKINRKKTTPNSLQARYESLNIPGFFEYIFSNQLIRPLMAIFLISTVMMEYMAVTEITTGGYFLLLIVGAQALYYSFCEQQYNSDLLAKMGRSLDDFFTQFPWNIFDLNFLYHLLSFCFGLAASAGIAFGILSLAPPIIAISTWPITLQYAVLIGISLYLFKIIHQVIKNIYTLIFENTFSNKKSLLANLSSCALHSCHIALVTIAETLEQFAMLITLINYGTCAQVFIAIYSLWYFFSRQMNYEYSTNYYHNNQINKINLETLQSKIWNITELLMVVGTVIGITMILFNPPLFFAPIVAALGLTVLPEVQCFIICLGIASVIANCIPLTINVLSYFFNGELNLAPKESPQKKVNSIPSEINEKSEEKRLDLFKPEPLDLLTTKEINQKFSDKLGFWVTVKQSSESTEIIESLYRPLSTGKLEI